MSGHPEGIGRELLSILFRYAHNLLIVLDPDSLASGIAMVFNPRTKQLQGSFLSAHEKDSLRGLFCVGDVVEDVRTVFERINDATIYIPRFEMELV